VACRDQIGRRRRVQKFTTSLQRLQVLVAIKSVAVGVYKNS